MKIRTVLFGAFLFFSINLNAQVISGDLVDAGRKQIGQIQYKIEGNASGWAKYELSVDRNGKVTSARLVETDIKSTPAKVQLRNHAMKMKFEAGTYYPEFHHVIVKFTMERKVVTTTEEVKP